MEIKVSRDSFNPSLLVLGFAGKAQGYGAAHQAGSGPGRDNHGDWRGTGGLYERIFKLDAAETDDIARFEQTRRKQRLVVNDGAIATVEVLNEVAVGLA